VDVSDIISAKAGNRDPLLLCDFDGRVLELWESPSSRFLASTLTLQKRKDEKDGGVTVSLLTTNARRELYFGPDELANMEALLAALAAAGMQQSA
jgi:hypothetical protein